MLDLCPKCEENYIESKLHIVDETPTLVMTKPGETDGSGVVVLEPEYATRTTLYECQNKHLIEEFVNDSQPDNLPEDPPQRPLDDPATVKVPTTRSKYRSS